MQARLIEVLAITTSWGRPLGLRQMVPKNTGRDWIGLRTLELGQLTLRTQGLTTRRRRRVFLPSPATTDRVCAVFETAELIRGPPHEFAATVSGLKEDALSRTARVPKKPHGTGSPRHSGWGGNREEGRRWKGRKGRYLWSKRLKC